MPSLFVKDPKLLQSIEKTIESFKKSKESYRFINSKPDYEIAVRRKDNNEIEYFIVNIINNNNLMFYIFIQLNINLNCLGLIQMNIK